MEEYVSKDMDEHEWLEGQDLPPNMIWLYEYGSYVHLNTR
jgi:hypothetical protein